MSSEFFGTATWWDVESRLREFTKMGHKPWLSNVDEQAVIETARKAFLNRDPTQGPQATIGHGMFCMYQIGRPWWGSRPVLQEEILFSVWPGHDLGAMMLTLERIARVHKCHGVVVGTSLSDRDEALCRALRSHGYSPVATELYKEIGAWDL